MSTELGQKAESIAANFLKNEHHFKIIDQNWRNRWCEIDIIAKDRFNEIHFVEVKYRKTSAYGSGFEYITPDKIQRLQRAALMWIGEHSWTTSFQVDVISVEGDLDHPVIEYLPNALAP